jgi:hypothetical protein
MVNRRVLDDLTVILHTSSDNDKLASMLGSAGTASIQGFAIAMLAHACGHLAQVRQPAIDGGTVPDGCQWCRCATRMPAGA